MATLCIVCPLPSKHLVSLPVGDTICVRSSHRLLSSSRICSNRFSELGVSSIIFEGCGVVGVTNSLVTGVATFDCDCSLTIAWCLLAWRVDSPPVSTSLSNRCPEIQLDRVSTVSPSHRTWQSLPERDLVSCRCTYASRSLSSCLLMNEFRTIKNTPIPTANAPVKTNSLNHVSAAGEIDVVFN